MKTICNIAIASVLCLGMLAVMTGCQMPGKMSSGSKEVVCPECNMPTTTALMKEVTYAKCACPTCKTVKTFAPVLNESLRNYVGYAPGATVHVCASCTSLVEPCPVCQKAAGM